MSVQNLAVAAVFEEIADRLAIQGANVFRVRAYRNAARMVQGLGPRREADARAWRGSLRAARHRPPTWRAKSARSSRRAIARCSSDLRQRDAAGDHRTAQVPGFGPKRVGAALHELDVQTDEQLLRAARDGRIRDAPRLRRKDGAADRSAQSRRSCRRRSASARHARRSTPSRCCTSLSGLRAIGPSHAAAACGACATPSAISISSVAARSRTAR